MPSYVNETCYNNEILPTYTNIKIVEALNYLLLTSPHKLKEKRFHKWIPVCLFCRPQVSLLRHRRQERNRNRTYIFYAGTKNESFC